MAVNEGFKQRGRASEAEWARSNDAALIAQLRKQIAQAHLSHDFGQEAAEFLTEQYPNIISGVIRQRHDLEAEGKLNKIDEAGNEVVVGKLDLKKLGVSDEHIAQAEALKAAESERVKGHHTAAAVSRTAGQAIGTGRAGPA